MDMTRILRASATFRLITKIVNFLCLVIYLPPPRQGKLLVTFGTLLTTWPVPHPVITAMFFSCVTPLPLWVAVGPTSAVAVVLHLWFGRCWGEVHCSGSFSPVISHLPPLSFLPLPSTHTKGMWAQAQQSSSIDSLCSSQHVKIFRLQASSIWNMHPTVEHHNTVRSHDLQHARHLQMNVMTATLHSHMCDITQNNTISQCGVLSQVAENPRLELCQGWQRSAETPLTSKVHKSTGASCRALSHGWYLCQKASWSCRWAAGCLNLPCNTIQRYLDDCVLTSSLQSVLTWKVLGFW